MRTAPDFRLRLVELSPWPPKIIKSCGRFHRCIRGLPHVLLPHRWLVVPEVVAAATRAVEVQVRQGLVDVVVCFPSPSSWGLRMLSSESSTRSISTPLGEGSNIGENWDNIVWEAWSDLWRTCLAQFVGLIIMSFPGVKFFDSSLGVRFKYHANMEWGLLHSCASGVALAEGPIENSVE